MIRILFFMSIISVSLSTSVMSDPLSRLTAQGNDLYLEGKFQEALKIYRTAQIESPESPSLHYNIGNALFKSNKYEDAATAFTKALATDDAVLQQQIYYNLGNTRFRQGETMMQSGDQKGLDMFKQAIASYKTSLELNPNDTDSKYNIEYVQQKLKEMAQNSDKNKQQNNQQNQKHQPPTRYALALKKRALALIAQRIYTEASELMQNGLQQDPTVANFNTFIEKIDKIIALKH